MTQIYTARVNYRGSDRFDVTRKTGGSVGEIFAPSWKILLPALRARHRVMAFMRSGDGTSASITERDAWRAYVPAYHAEMRVSFREYREEWEELLSRSSATLVCYCSPTYPCCGGDLHCHRVLLAGYLERLGARNMGERVSPADAQRELAWGSP